MSSQDDADQTSKSTMQTTRTTSEQSDEKAAPAVTAEAKPPNAVTEGQEPGDQVVVDENAPVFFPVDDLQRLDEMLNRTRWVVPVLPKNELETLLDASIALCRQNIDTRSEPCQRFFREGLMISFTKVLTDEAVNTWKYDIYKHIYNNTLKAIELCTLKLLDDWFPLLDLLAMIFNPQCKYHLSNSMRSAELVVKVITSSQSNANFNRSVTTTTTTTTAAKHGGKTRTNRTKPKTAELKDESKPTPTPKSSAEEQTPPASSTTNDKENVTLSDKSPMSGRRRGGFSSELLVSFKNNDDDNDEEATRREKQAVRSDAEDDGDSDTDSDDDGDDEYEDVSVEETTTTTTTNGNDEEPDEQEEDAANELTTEKAKDSGGVALKEGQDEFGKALLKVFNDNAETGDCTTATVVNKPPSDQVAKATKPTKLKSQTKTTTTYARSYLKAPYGWLVDFINYFGQLNGFKLLLDRFQSKSKLNIQLIAALLKPWGLCYEFLTPYTVRTYFLPIIEIVPKFFENLSDEDIKKECKSESRNDSISTVIKWLKLLATRVQNQDDLVKNLEILRFKTILRILKFASFNGKMNALNEVNKVISNITYNVQLKASSSLGTSIVGPPSSSSGYGVKHHDSSEEEWLTPDRMAKWIQENEVLDIVLRDCMHQPQYVEKLEKILRFLIKEKALTLKDLDKIWESQLGKHEAIEKNVHDLLSKLAWDFTPEQLDHLFSCFQKSWTVASKKQQEKLLDLIRSLSEDDKEGVMANKVLDLLWNLAHSDDAPTEIIDQAVAAHIKILDYSCSSDKESQKLKCLEKCIEQLKENKWVIVSMRQIREILQQYSETITGNFQTSRLMNYTTPGAAAGGGQSSSAGQQTSSSNLLTSGSNLNLLNSSQQQQQMGSPIGSSATAVGPGSNHHAATTTGGGGAGFFYRHDVIAKLQKEYSLISMITANLNGYYESIRKYVSEHEQDTGVVEPETLLPDDRFNHLTQIQERLNFMKYLLKEGHLWLCSAQAETIWKCLAQNSVFECDREICFKWFAKLMTDDPDLEPEMNREFFVNYVTKLDPKLLTDSGIRCFDRFFKNVNLKCNHLVQKRHYFLTENLDLIGLDYLWRIVTFANEEIVEKAILLLKDIYIHLGPQLKSEQTAIHADLISACMDRLKVSYDKLTVIHKLAAPTPTSSTAQQASKETPASKEQEENDEVISNQEITRILRVMIVLREYLNEFDSNYLCERVFPPLSRASKGKSILILVRIQVQNRQTEDLEMLTHINETIGSLRRQIYIKAKVNPQVNRIDLIVNNECVECVDDNKVLADYQLKEKMFIVARITQTASMLNTSSSGGNGAGAGGAANNNQTTAANTSVTGHASGAGSGHNRVDSSVDSSSDEYGSGAEDSHNVINSPNIESELQLPSVILSLNEQYIQFLIELADFGCKINNTHIKECTRGILDLLPIAKHTADKMKQFCKDCIVNQEAKSKSTAASNANSSPLDSLYFNCTQTQCWYFLKVTHAMLMPAMSTFNTDETKQFQENFILAGGVSCAKNMLAKDSFLANADDNTKKAALFYVLKINKLTMTTVCYSIYSFVINAVSTKQFSQITNSQHEHALLLQSSASSIPSNTNEINVRQLSQRLGTQFSTLLVNNLPELSHIVKLERIAWSLAASGTLNLVAAPQHEQIHDALVNGVKNGGGGGGGESMADACSADDINVCREALEDLSLCLCLVPHALETLNQEKHWRTFLVDMVLLCGNRIIRQSASEQFLLIALKCSPQPTRPIQFFIQMLFTCLHTLTKENAQQSQEYFYLLCRLLNCAYLNSVQISNTETLLNNELMWLKKVKQSAVGAAESNMTGAGKQAPSSSSSSTAAAQDAELSVAVDEMLLDGHLSITKELLLFQNAEKKHSIGCHPQGVQLINDLIEYFIFPASYLFKKYRDSFINNSLAITNNSSNSSNNVNSALITQQVAQAALNNFEQLLAYKSLKSICSSPLTTVSAFDLLVSLCTGCQANFVFLTDLLFQLFYPSLLPNPVKNLLSSAASHSASSTATTAPTAALSSYSDIHSSSYPVSSTFNSAGANSSPNQNLLLTNDCTIAQNEWEYIPPIGQRPHNGFVGLKNAGATCYMNSVLQQLFMIKAIRNFILSVEIPSSPPAAAAQQANSSCGDASSRDSGVYSSGDAITSSATTSSAQHHHHHQPTSLFDDLDEADALTSNHTLLNSSLNTAERHSAADEKGGDQALAINSRQQPLSEEEQRKEYNVNIIKNLQMIFGHLAESKMQYYVPKGFWRQFRFGGGERVNLREQHDAVEFFNTLVDYIDEAMKSLSREQICSKVLGGKFADQKICKGCPHRYSREESFTLLSVDVKHSSRLTESLEQYVKGDLLEGPNAYHCEKCNKKIDAVKRTCIKKLPMVLAIQLKRFDYDWEREIAVKSNEYFEFPRVLDMEPYTVKGIARIDQQQQQQLMKQQMKSKQQQTADLLMGGGGGGVSTEHKMEAEVKERNSESEQHNSLNLQQHPNEHDVSLPGSSNEPGSGGEGIRVVNEGDAGDEGDEDEDEDDDEDLNSQTYSNMYKLVGIVVHSGQANGGHYYSFIRNKSSSSSSSSSNLASSSAVNGSNANANTGGVSGSNNAASNSNDDDSSTSTSENNNQQSSSSNAASDSHWYKFDDGDVSEFKMDEEEMRNQCYGGDYTGEVYDNIVKRMAYKKQKRWWNAYILFYERLPRTDSPRGTKDATNGNASFTCSSTSNIVNNNNNNSERDESSSAKSSGISVGSASLDAPAVATAKKMDELTSSISSIQLQQQQPVKMPANILKSVHKKNIKFLHHRHHFSPEYFQFIKKLTQANFGYCQSGEQAMSDEGEELCLASVQLAVKFLFSVGFRVKKTLRGPVNDWYEILYNYAKHSYKARQWLARYFLVENSIVIPQYLLDCPSNEIRSTISKMLVALVHLANTDAPMELKLSEICAPSSSLAVFVAASASQQQLLSASQQAQPIDPNKSRLISVSDSIIQTLLSILGKRDLINEQSSKYLIQFFQFFTIYCSLGIQQCIHLIRSDVPLQFIQFALDELPMTNSNINFNLSSSSSSSSVSLNSYVSAKISNLNQNMNGNGGTSQYADLTKLYVAVSNLLRCFDVSPYCSTLQQASNANSNSVASGVPSNPYSHMHELRLQHQQQQQQLSPSELALLNSAAGLKLPTKIEEYVYKRANYVKKLLEDAPNLEETVKLMKFLAWENMTFSTTLLNELLWMAAYHYSYELKPHLEMLYHILNINDSWQSRRIAYAFQGVPNEKDGLFDIIARSQNHYQKRAYQIIKMLVQLLTTCELAIDILNKDEELKKKWKASRNWFFNEMEKCRLYNMPNYTYFQSPQSNETSQTYYLERTQSARITLEKAMKIFPPTSSQSATSISKLANSSGTGLSPGNLNTSGTGADGQQPATSGNSGDAEEPIENEPEEEDDDDDEEEEEEEGEEEEEEEEEDYESISDDENLRFRLQKIQADTKDIDIGVDELADVTSKDDEKTPVD